MPPTQTKHSCAARLAKSDHLRYGRFKDFVKEMLEMVSKSTDVERTSFWLFHPRQKKFQVLAAYDSSNDHFFTEGQIPENQAPGFYHLALNKYSFKVEDSSTCKEIAELDEWYGSGRRAKSMLTHQVIYEGKVLGLICFEQVSQPRYWSNIDEIEIGYSSSLLQQAYQTSLDQQGGVDREVLFLESPVPVWIFDTNTLEILDGNQKALELYGFSELSSFVGESMLNLIHPSHRMDLDELLSKKGLHGWKHVDLIQQRRDGLALMSRLSSSVINYKNTSARIVVVIDAKKEKEIEKEKDQLLKKLNDHAFYASHNLRSPIANILGLLDLIKISWDDRENYEELLFRLKIQTMNLDEAVRVMSAKIEMDHLG